jgi:CHAT domain-containing protein
MRAIAIMLLLSIGAPVFADEPKPPELTPEEQKLADAATELNRVGFEAWREGRYVDALPKMRQALEIRQKIYPATKYPDGHPDLEQSLTNLAAQYEGLGQADQALSYYRQGLEMNQKLYPIAKYPDGHPAIAYSLNRLSHMLLVTGRAEQALTISQQSLKMCQKLYPLSTYPNGHPDLARALNSHGTILAATGQAEQALMYKQQSLEMFQKLFPATNYPNGHTAVASAINNVGFILQKMGQAEQALPYFRRSLEMRQKLYPVANFPNGHPELADSLGNLGFILALIGQPEQALPYCRRNLEMNQKLYPTATFPNGHPDLARSLANLATVFEAMGQMEQALHYYRQSLEMDTLIYPAAKYPNGHPTLVSDLGNLAYALLRTGQTDQAVQTFRDSLAMCQKNYPTAKYPDGHPSVARGLNNLGFVLSVTGQPEQALPYYRQSLEMRQKLYSESKYPDGHPELTSCLSGLGCVLVAMEQPEQAVTYFRRCLVMQQQLLRRELLTTSEEAAFDKVFAQPLYRDAYLSVTRTVNQAAGDVLGTIWLSQAMVTRLIEQRHAAARLAGTEAGQQLDRLRGLRRHTEQLLQNSRMQTDDRDRQLAAVAAERDQLERDLAALIPAWQHWRQLDQLGPADLAKALPPGAAFLEIIRYAHFEYVDKLEHRTPKYVAFVILNPSVADASRYSIARVELEEAEPINKAVQQWRTAIESRQEAPEAAAELSRRVWDKIAPYLPPGTKTVYIAADSDLARLPWAALLVGKGRVLLEDFALAQVPHGIFLLDQLKFRKQSAGKDSLLTLGGVDYGPGIWPALPATAVETSAIAALAPVKPESLSGKNVTTDNLKALLPHVRYVHFATHGEFKAEELTAEQKRAAEALKSTLQGDFSRRIAAKNPLGYVGLVLSNGEILSGLGIVDLPLQNVQLVTLSACETGLGQYTGGEGVQGLQRAFHLAGCPNVIASLWKVNDAASAALMTKFYHEMWNNKQPPIEALRAAQLTIYHHPEMIPDLAGERGAPKLKEAVANPAKPQEAGRADTKLWAAFVLSGIGK